MEKLVEGFKKFQNEVFRAKRELFSHLSQRQEPRALFITCSDSRIDPTLLTQADSSFSGTRAISCLRTEA